MIYLFSFTIFLAVVFLMAMGVRQTIQGSCGGLASIEIDSECHCVDTYHEHARVFHQTQEP